MRLFVKGNSTIAVVSVGLILFFLLFGFQFLNPANVNWLLNGDPATHYIGWEFFRKSPWLIPIGSNPNYGMQLGSSIVFSDTIPLLAILFKLFNSVLPITFQYTGSWILLCLILQGLFANKLLSLYKIDFTLRIVSIIFYVLSPVLLWRLHGHYALASQWLILAGLYFYLKGTVNTTKWLLLLCVSLLVHAYLYLTILLIWIADNLRKIISKEKRLLNGVCIILISLCLSLFLMWMIGYFMVGGDVSTGGFGIYRFNLLSPLNPFNSENIITKVLNFQNWGPGDYEGYSYLGIGMVFLLILALTKINYSDLIDLLTAKKIVLYSAFIIFLCISVSNKVAFGRHEIINFELPTYLKNVTGIVRCSGRFIWPIYYYILTTTLVLICTRFSKNTAIIILIAAVFLQVYDLKDNFSIFKRKYVIDSNPNQLSSESWSIIAKNYKKIIYLFPSNSPSGWIPLCQYAASNNIPINIGYFARVDIRKQEQETTVLFNKLKNNIFDTNALYVFSNKILWDYSNKINNNDKNYIKIDGYYLYAPKIDFLEPELKSKINSKPTKNISNKNEKDVIDFKFCRNGNGNENLVFGWYTAEDWGVWSSEYSLIFLEKPQSLCNNPTLIIKALSICDNQNNPKVIDVIINEKFVSKISFDSNNPKDCEINIPVKILDNSNYISVQFVTKNPISPKELGMSSDTRKLGIGLMSLHFK